MREGKGKNLPQLFKKIPKSEGRLGVLSNSSDSSRFTIERKISWPSTQQGKEGKSQEVLKEPALLSSQSESLSRIDVLPREQYSPPPYSSSSYFSPSFDSPASPASPVSPDSSFSLAPLPSTLFSSRSVTLEESRSKSHWLKNTESIPGLNYNSVIEHSIIQEDELLRALCESYGFFQSVFCESKVTACLQNNFETNFTDKYARVDTFNIIEKLHFSQKDIMLLDEHLKIFLSSKKNTDGRGIDALFWIMLSVHATLGSLEKLLALLLRTLQGRDILCKISEENAMKLIEALARQGLENKLFNSVILLFSTEDIAGELRELQFNNYKELQGFAEQLCALPIEARMRVPVQAVSIQGQGDTLNRLKELYADALYKLHQPLLGVLAWGDPELYRLVKGKNRAHIVMDSIKEWLSFDSLIELFTGPQRRELLVNDVIVKGIENIKKRRKAAFLTQGEAMLIQTLVTANKKNLQKALWIQYHRRNIEIILQYLADERLRSKLAEFRYSLQQVMLTEIVVNLTGLDDEALDPEKCQLARLPEIQALIPKDIQKICEKNSEKMQLCHREIRRISQEEQALGDRVESLEGYASFLSIIKQIMHTRNSLLLENNAVMPKQSDTFYCDKVYIPLATQLIKVFVNSIGKEKYFSYLAKESDMLYMHNYLAQVFIWYMQEANVIKKKKFNSKYATNVIAVFIDALKQQSVDEILFEIHRYICKCFYNNKSAAQSVYSNVHFIKWITEADKIAYFQANLQRITPEQANAWLHYAPSRRFLEFNFGGPQGEVLSFIQEVARTETVSDEKYYSMEEYNAIKASCLQRFLCEDYKFFQSIFYGSEYEEIDRIDIFNLSKKFTFSQKALMSLEGHFKLFLKNQRIMDEARINLLFDLMLLVYARLESLPKLLELLFRTKQGRDILCNISEINTTALTQTLEQQGLPHELFKGLILLFKTENNAVTLQELQFRNYQDLQRFAERICTLPIEMSMRMPKQLVNSKGKKCVFNDLKTLYFTALYQLNKPLLGVLIGNDPELLSMAEEKKYVALIINSIKEWLTFDSLTSVFTESQWGQLLATEGLTSKEQDSLVKLRAKPILTSTQAGIIQGKITLIAKNQQKSLWMDYHKINLERLLQESNNESCRSHLLKLRYMLQQKMLIKIADKLTSQDETALDTEDCQLAVLPAEILAIISKKTQEDYRRHLKKMRECYKNICTIREEEERNREHMPIIEGYESFLSIVKQTMLSAYSEAAYVLLTEQLSKAFIQVIGENQAFSYLKKQSTMLYMQSGLVRDFIWCLRCEEIFKYGGFQLDLAITAITKFTPALIRVIVDKETASKAETDFFSQSHSNSGIAINGSSSTTTVDYPVLRKKSS